MSSKKIIINTAIAKIDTPTKMVILLYGEMGDSFAVIDRPDLFLQHFKPGDYAVIFDENDLVGEDDVLIQAYHRLMSQ